MTLFVIYHTYTKENMTFYIIDTTLNPAQEKQFQSYPEVVNYLNDMSKRAYGQDRKQRTILLEEMGHGADDLNATLFVRAMQDQFNIGILREGRRMRCDLSELVAFQKPEYGD